MQPPITTPTPRFAPTGEAGQRRAPGSDTVTPMTTAKHAAPSYRIGAPIVVALLLIAAVWIGGAVWSFAEQTAYANFKHFEIPELLPLVIDGLAVAMAAVAWAASLDGRAAVAARLGAAVAVAGSATSNAAWAWERSGADVGTVALAIAVPVAANIAFEVLLAEIRKQVQRFRGLPGPVPIAYPRLIGLALSPWRTYFTWRQAVLAAVDVRRQFATLDGSATVPAGGSDTPAVALLAAPYPLPAGRFRTVPDGVAKPLDGTPTEPRHPSDGTGIDTPAAGVPAPFDTPRSDTPVGVPANGSDTPASTPVRNPDSTPTGHGSADGAAPALTSDGTPAGTAVGTPPGTPVGTPGRDGADTPAEYPADAVLLPVLRNPARVPRDPDGTVPIKRAMRVLKIGRDRAVRVLRAEGLLREPIDETPDDDTVDTPVNGSAQHPELAGITS